MRRRTAWRRPEAPAKSENFYCGSKFPVGAVSDQTKLEMERGRIIAGRAKRHSDLTRYMSAKKVQVVCASPGHPLYAPGPSLGEVHLFYVNGVQIGHECTWQDDYPSEAIIAKIALCVGATVGFEGIKPEMTIDKADRQRMDHYRDRYVKTWSNDQ